MARRFKINDSALASDVLQSIPRATREANKRAYGASERPARMRRHAARVIGAATIASLLAFFLAITPENPDLQNAKKALAKIQTIPDNPVHTNAATQTGNRNNGQAKHSGLGKRQRST